MLALMVALCLASTLGQIHRALHVPGLQGASASAAASPDRSGSPSLLAAASAGAAIEARTALSAGVRAQGAKPMPATRRGALAAPAGLLALFGDHADADCRLYDQLAGGAAALCVPLVVLPVALPTALFAFFEGEYLARWVALFDARGPPPTR